MPTKYASLIDALNLKLGKRNDGELSVMDFENDCNTIISEAHDAFVIDTIEEKLLVEQARGIILGIEKEFTEPKL